MLILADIYNKPRQSPSASFSPPEFQRLNHDARISKWLPGCFCKVRADGGKDWFHVLFVLLMTKRLFWPLRGKSDLEESSTIWTKKKRKINSCDTSMATRHNSYTHIAVNEWSTWYYPFILSHWSVNVELWLCWIFTSMTLLNLNSIKCFIHTHAFRYRRTNLGLTLKHRFHTSWWARDGFVYSVCLQPGNYCDMAWFFVDVCACVCAPLHCTGGRQQGRAGLWAGRIPLRWK